MATTLYPTSQSSAITSTSAGFTSANTFRRILDFSRGSGVVSQSDATIASLSTVPVASAGSWAVVQGGSNVLPANGAATTVGGNAFIFISPPLLAVTIAGTITVNQRALESANQANYGAQALVGKIPANGGATVTIGSGGNVTELGTAESARSISITPTSTALADGDSLFLIFGYGSAGGTSASAQTATTFWAGASGATGDSFVTFTETIVARDAPRPQQRSRQQAVSRASFR